MNNNEFSKKFKARLFCLILRVVKFCECLDWKNPLARVVRFQLVKSITSIGANYFEAIAGSSRKDFANFNNHSLKSANESQFWLLLLKEAELGDLEELDALLLEVEEIARIFGSIVKSLREKKK
ncbi:four helix bundle protein [Candidatus Kuenenbacteria bacterium]|nr:four helix bundle protein [Candidatus Kuenenbacteria bacterium]